MRYILTFLLFFSITRCTFHKGPLDEPRKTAHYTGIDPKVFPIMVKYALLARKHDIAFRRDISVGFTDIGDGPTVGICFYGKNFREIEIDNKEWNTSSEITREQLLFHELTHCLCGRDHSFINKDGDLQEYPSVGFEEFLTNITTKWPFYLPLPGRYVDGCPTSYMFPHVLHDQCVIRHKEEYLEEMFYECEPW